MRKVEVGQKAVTIRMSENEMPPERADISRLVRRALAEQGMEPWEAVEAECFAAGGEVLVMARPGTAHPKGLVFAALELLLSAAAVCGTGDGELYRMEEGYLLVLPPESVHPVLYEYGEERPVHPDWTCHAREQGLCLLEENAVAQLVRIFSTSQV